MVYVGVYLVERVRKEKDIRQMTDVVLKLSSFDHLFIKGLGNIPIKSCICMYIRFTYLTMF